MINRTFKLCTLALAITFSTKAISQVTSVSYKLKFNDETSLYECYLKIDKGFAKETRHRTQYNAQITFALPSGSDISIAENYMPLENNINLNSNKPQRWHISNRVNNKSNDGQDYIGIVPRLSPTAFYNELNEGDEVKLFSFKVNPLPKCGEGVRLFENSKDPASLEKVMDGGDFRNGFTVGDVRQKYIGNLEFENSALPKGDIPSIGTVYETMTLKLQSGVWTNADSYVWTGPNGFYSNQQNPLITRLGKNNNGQYTLTVKSKDGCSATKSVNVKVEPMDKYALTETESVLSDVDTDARNTDVIATLETSARVYPNPATNFINVTISGYKGAVVKSSIFDIEGKVAVQNVLNQKMESSSLEKTVPLKLIGGVYTLVTSIDGVEHTSKFLFIE